VPLWWAWSLAIFATGYLVGRGSWWAVLTALYAIATLLVAAEEARRP
jgi:hypothetical protein